MLAIKYRDVLFLFNLKKVAAQH